MCNRCTIDPRDRISQAERALWSLRSLVNHLPPGSDMPAEDLGPLLSLVHDHFDEAADAIQGYVPRDFDPKNV